MQNLKSKASKLFKKDPESPEKAAEQKPGRFSTKDIGKPIPIEPTVPADTTSSHNALNDNNDSTVTAHRTPPPRPPRPPPHLCPPIPEPSSPSPTRLSASRFSASSFASTSSSPQSLSALRAHVDMNPEAGAEIGMSPPSYPRRSQLLMEEVVCPGGGPEYHFVRSSMENRRASTGGEGRGALWRDERGFLHFVADI